MKYCFVGMGLDPTNLDTLVRGMYESMFSGLRRRGDEVVLPVDAPDASGVGGVVDF